MPERSEEQAAERLDRLATDLLAGRHLKAKASDAADRHAIWAAARLAGARQGHPRMSPAFRRRLAAVLAKGETSNRLTRRAALVAGLAAAASAAGAIGFEELTRVRQAASSRQPAASPGPVAPATAGPPSSRSVIEPRGDSARWLDTGILFADLVEGQPRSFRAGSFSTFLFRKGGEVVGMSAICTHLPCELVWRSRDHVLNCPCHPNQNFDSDGLSLAEGFKLPPLPLVRTRVRNGRVEVLGTA
jgi:cytochrome b6-f complex iron-sulfur subunit